MPRTGARVRRPPARAPKQVRGKPDPVEAALRWLEEKGARQVKIAGVDLSTARMIPWEPATAAFLLDFVMPDGSDYPPSPRALLRRVGQRARKLGFLPKFGSEYEFFIFRETPASLRAKGFQNLEPLDPGMFGYSWLRTSQSSDLVHA